MRTLAILPIKSFAAAKQRLGDLLGSGSRRALAQAMSSDVLTSLKRVRRIDAIAVVSADPTVQVAAGGDRVLTIRDANETGQSAAAKLGIRHALDGGFDRVLLVPGDTPLLDPAEVDGLLAGAEARELEVVIVPDRHDEGTNALLLSPADALEPSFGPGSLHRHVATAEATGRRWSVEQVPSLSVDVDTPDDLAELGAALGQRRGLAPMTRGALRQLESSRVRGSSTREPAALSR